MSDSIVVVSSGTQGPPGAGALYPPPPSWSVTDWYVDPANPASTDTGPGSITVPFKTIGAIETAWGTRSAAFSAGTVPSLVVHVLSVPSTPENVVLEPIKFNGANFAIIGTLAPVATTTISTLTPKNYATNTQYAITVPSGVLSQLAAGMTITNTSRSNSWARIKSISGSTVHITQPFAATPFTGAVVFDPAYDETWAPGDPIAVGSPLRVNLQLRPKGGNGLAGYAGGVTWVQNLAFTTSSGQAFYSYIALNGEDDYIADYVGCTFECITYAHDRMYLVGCYSPTLLFLSGQFVVLLGGYYGFVSFKSTDLYADCDTIIGGGEVYGTLVTFGRVWLDTVVGVSGASLHLDAYVTDVKICGAGGLDASFGGRVVLSVFASETWTQAVFAPTLTLEGASTGTARGGSFGAVAITPASLDAQLGKTLSNPDTGARFTYGGS